MDNRRKQSPTRDERKATIAMTMRATKEIAELPKCISWLSEGGYVADTIDRVLDVCERVGMMPTVSLLASALGVPKDTVEDVRNGYIASNPDVVSALVMYHQVCENTLVQSSLDGTTNNISGIFAMKSMYGYKEEPRQVVVTHNKLLGDRKDTKAIAQRYEAAMVVDGTIREIEDKQDVEAGECDF